MLIAVLPVVYFVVAVVGFARKHRKVTALTAVVMAIAGTLGYCILFSTIVVTSAEGIIRIIARAARRIGAWLCHTFVVDFALVIRTSLRIAFSSESPKTWFRRPTNLAATFRS